MIDLTEYKDLFASEAQEHLETMNSGLLILERNPEDTLTLEAIFRAAHSLKGMAATMGYQDLAHVAHTLEDLLDELRKGNQRLTPALADVVLSGVDALTTLLADALADRPASLDIGTLTDNLKTGAVTAAEDRHPPADVPSRDIAAMVEPDRPTQSSIGLQTPELPQTIRVKAQTLDSLLNLVAELVISRSRLWRIQRRHNLLDLGEALEEHDRLLTDLRNAVLQARMVPVAQVFNRFPRMVRDLLKERGKEADFRIEGSDIELDRTLLERVTDPLMHLLRNAVDHGIEPPEERRRNGKEPRGTIRLIARRERESAVLEVTDDGTGLNREQIVETAIRRGLISRPEAEELSYQQALMLICHPGFSTAERVTEISGRGVGMDVVRRQVEFLQGSLHIETRPGAGTTFRLRLPRTLAITRALLVAVGEETYALPLSQVERTLEIEPGQVRQVQRQQVLANGNLQTLPLVDLREVLGVPGDAPGRAGPGYAVVVGENRDRIGLVADNLLYQEEIVIRPLPPAIGSIPGLAGATILGEGQVVLVLDAPHLV